MEKRNYIIVVAVIMIVLIMSVLVCCSSSSNTSSTESDDTEYETDIDKSEPPLEENEIHEAIEENLPEELQDLKIEKGWADVDVLSPFDLDYTITSQGWEDDYYVVRGSGTAHGTSGDEYYSFMIEFDDEGIVNDVFAS